MWPQLGEVMCFECHWEQKSSPCVQTHLLYSITFLVPAPMLMLLFCRLKKRCELVAEMKPEKKDVFSVGWALDVLLWAEHELTSTQGSTDDCRHGAQTRMKLSPPGLPTPHQWCAVASQDTTYALLIHLSLLPGFWHPFLAEASCEVGDRQTVWN